MPAAVYFVEGNLPPPATTGGSIRFRTVRSALGPAPPRLVLRQLQFALHYQARPSVGILLHAALVVEQHGVAQCVGIDRPPGQLRYVGVSRTGERDPRRTDFFSEGVGFRHPRNE